jgi:hypothetical protein
MTLDGTAAFSDHLVRANGLDEQGFVDWVFRPGMLFDSDRNWWGQPGRRRTTHEGVDFCYFLRSNGIAQLDDSSKVPAPFAGRVAAIIDDFLSQTVIIDSGALSNGKARQLTLLAHIAPLTTLEPGSAIAEGEVVGHVAPRKRQKNELPPHLHVSIGVVSTSVDLETLDWPTIVARRVIELLDPLPLLLTP